MRSISLNIGELEAVQGPVRFSLYGIGSCIGLFLYDSRSGVTGAAHIMLPGRWNNDVITPGCFSRNAIESLLAKMKSLGCEMKNLKAKLTGGANILHLRGVDTGNRNLFAVSSELEQRNISIESSDCGGDFSRTAIFYSATRDLEVTSRQNQSYQKKI